MNNGIVSFPRGMQDLLLLMVPVGVGFDWWDDVVPRGYILPFGQDVLQSQYPKLYAQWTRGGVHKYGAGSVANSTKAPDKRGRHSVGRDDMGGTAASRVTSGVSGINGATLGAAGGDERAPLHAHTPGTLAGDSAGAHSHTVGLVADATASISSGGASSASNTTTSTDGAHGHTISGSTANSGAGSSQNMTPSIICNYIIRAG